MKTNSISKIIAFMVVLLFTAAAYAGVPRPPSDLKLQVKDNGILLTWKASPDDPENVTAYEVVRSTLASGPFKQVGKVKKGATEFFDRTAKPENIYFYKVRSIMGESFSNFTRPVTGEITGSGLKNQKSK